LSRRVRLLFASRRAWAVAGFLLFAMCAAADEPEALHLQITYAKLVWPQEVRRGETALFYVHVRNDTDLTMPEVELLLTTPPGWAAQLQTDRLEALAPHESRSTRLTVQSPRTIFDQWGEIAVEARSGLVYSWDDVTIKARPPQALWPGVGAALAVLIGSLFTFLFLYLSRRNRQETGGPQ
jgi:uncharacterized membrane protein